MTDREQAIKDVAEAIDDGEDFVSGYAEDYDDEDEYGRAVNYAVSQRERVIQLERALREFPKFPSECMHDNETWYCVSCQTVYEDAIVSWIIAKNAVLEGK